MIRLCEIAGCSVLLPSELEKRSLYRVGEISGCAVLLPSFLKEEVAGCVVLLPSALSERKLRPLSGISGCTVLVPWVLEQALGPSLPEEPALSMTGSTVAMLKESTLSLNDLMVALPEMLEENTLSEGRLPQASLVVEMPLTCMVPIPVRKIRYPRFLTRHKTARLVEHAVN